MGLSDYLAQNYLTADGDKQSKKRKRKAAKSGLEIADDDLTGWSKSKNGHDDGDEDTPMLVAGTTSGKTTTWKTVGSAAPTNAEQEAADAILTQAAKERQATAAQDEDAPAVVEGDGYDIGPDPSAPQMASGAMAGLQSAAQVTAALGLRKELEKRSMKDAGLDPTGKASETIYRDASGRIINVAMKRAELRREAEEKEKAKEEELQSRVGDVQRREKAAAKERLAEAKYLSLSRYADDAELNNDQKEQARWNDPAMQFLTTKTTNATKSESRRKQYQGAAEPNRYDIKPGYRWNGVDRGNGFERKWFAARNRKNNVRDLEYAWEMDE